VLLSLSNDSPQGASDSYFARFSTERVLDRLKKLDGTARRDGLAAVDASSPIARIGMEIDGSGRVTKNSYGVFNLAWQAQEHPEWAEQVAAEVAEIRAAIRTAHQCPLRFLVWAGMGGSAEDKSMYNAAGLLKRGPRCYVLDSTDPAKLKCILDDMERRHGLSITAILRSTLVVGMAMGMTSYEPVVNLEKLANLYERYRIDSRPNFVYMTLPDSLLDRFGRERGYRRIELQLDGANTTAGRHSGPLTRGSLYPLALARTDLRAWMAATTLSDANVQTAWRLAAFLHAQGEAGRDKVTLMLPKHWAGAAIWTKQDFEESLGKSEQLGIKIIPCAKPRLASYHSPRDAQQDRAFLAVAVKGLPGPDSAKTGMLRRAGYPLAVLTFPREAQLSAFMQFIHYTVFGMGYLRDMNFVTQPSVELYKSIANCIFKEAEAVGGTVHTAAWKQIAGSPRQAPLFCGALTLNYDRLPIEIDSDGLTAPQIYAKILKKLASERKIEYGELTFFGDTRYSARGAAVRKRLEHAAEALFERRLNMPADVYEGPAMNHSYHEMIIGHGKCFSTVLVSDKQEQLPSARYAPEYHLAQFLATQMALGDRGRAVVSIGLKNLEESSLHALDEFFHRAAACLRSGRI
jgi:glucose-6-phosphate isomerase